MATPDKAATMPAMVGTVAFDTPEAIDRGFPEPEIAMTSNTSIIPVTVPSKPSSGQSRHTGLDQCEVTLGISGYQ